MSVRNLVSKFLDSTEFKNEDIPLMDALKIVHSRIGVAMQIHTEQSEAFARWGAGKFVTCPECHSETLLEFGGCHWCGHLLLDETKPSPTVALKDETKEVKSTPDGKTKKDSTKKEVKTEVTEKKDAEVKPKKETTKKNNKKETPADPDFEDDVVVETPAKEEVKKAVPSKSEQLKLIRELFAKAKDTDTKAPELKEIVELTKIGVEIAKFKKLSEFRAAIVTKLEKILDTLQAEVRKEEAELAKKSKNDKVAETSKAAEKKALVVEVDEADLDLDGEIFDEDDSTEDLLEETTDVDFEEGGEAVELEKLDVEDLSAEDDDDLFNLGDDDLN